MEDAAEYFTAGIRAALGDAALPGIEFQGAGALPSVYAVTDLAAATIGSAIAEIAALSRESQDLEVNGHVRVDRRLASCWFQGTIKPEGWKLPPVWDEIAGDYRGADGWIRLHTNAPHHRAAALRVLACQADKSVVSAEIENWSVDELEAAVVAESGCAAAMRSAVAWQTHPNGAAVAREPLIDQTPGELSRSQQPAADPSRPLAGIRVLDLTRVLAGPVCTRFLAGWGADVLRIDPPDWNEGIVIPEVVLGKRCARLDLKSRSGLEVLERLLSEADVLVHGYRADALERLGLSARRRSEIRPGLIDVCLDAYGWSGPWSTRRGFDSLVQMSCGIAEAGMRASGRDTPFPLPAQALDHGTGYLLAAATVRALRARRTTGYGTRVRCSLARTAGLLMSGPAGDLHARLDGVTEADWAPEPEITSWGPARRLRPPGDAEGLQMAWAIPAGELGRSRTDLAKELSL